jgi:hypothetical protein
MLWPIIRNPPVHVPPSLATTCQLQPVSRKAERNTISLLPHASKKTFRTGLPGKPVRANLLTMVWSDYIWPVAAGDNEVNHPALSDPVKHLQEVGAVRVKADMAGSIYVVCKK